MKKLISICILIVMAASPALSQEITGKWYGKADTGGIILRILFDISEDAGNYSGYMISLDQSPSQIPLIAVSFENDTLMAQIKGIDFLYKGVLKPDNTLEGNFTQMGGNFQLNMSREPIVINRPQEPKRPFPYVEEEITFRNEKAGINLAGTLTLPQEQGKFPAVILVSGSGAQNRDEELMAHKPFLLLSDYLTRQGVAVLRYDDRGVEKSEGEYRTANIQDFATDASAALAYLKTRKEIDPQKVGVVGHSEGGCIAFMLAAQKEPSFIISLAGMGINGKELLTLQRAAILKGKGVKDDYIAENNRQINEAMELGVQLNDVDKLEKEIIERFPILAPEARSVAKQFTSPELMSLFLYDPDDYYKDIKCPVLALNGGKDVQVIADPNLENIEKQLSAHGNNQVTIKKYPELNHLFQTAKWGMPEEYGQIEETMSPEVLKDIAEWILQFR